MGLLACAHSGILAVVFYSGIHRCHPSVTQQCQVGKVSGKSMGEVCERACVCVYIHFSEPFVCVCMSASVGNK